MSRERWLIALASVAGALVWIAAGELETPARVFTTLLVGLLPALLMLQARPPVDELRDRSVLPVYLSSIAFISALGIAALWVGRASGFTHADLGLVRTSPVTLVAWTGAMTLGAFTIVAAFRMYGVRESPLVEWLLPKRTHERIVFVLLSISAGAGEELAFRGFLVPALERATGSSLVAVVVSSAAFGMMHSYQQASGALRASALGALLALPVLVTGSIYPSMLAHAAYDIIAGLALADWLMRAPRRNAGDSARKH